MVRTILGLLFALWIGAAQAQPTIGPQPLLCNLVDTHGGLNAGTTQIITGVPGKIISICGFTFDENANGTAQIVFGTGSSCTSSTPITSVWTTLTNQYVVNHPSYAWVSSLPGQSVCAIVTGTGSVITIDTYYIITP